MKFNHCLLVLFVSISSSTMQCTAYEDQQEIALTGSQTTERQSQHAKLYDGYVLFDRSKLLAAFKAIPGGNALVRQIEQGDTNKMVMVQNPDEDYEGIVLAGIHNPSPFPSAIQRYFWEGPPIIQDSNNHLWGFIYHFLKEIGCIATGSIVSGIITNAVLNKYMPQLNPTLQEILPRIAGLIGGVCMLYALSKSYELLHAYHSIRYIRLPKRNSIYADNVNFALPWLYPISTEWTLYPLSIESLRTMLRNALIDSSKLDKHQLSEIAVSVYTQTIYSISECGFDDWLICDFG